MDLYTICSFLFNFCLFNHCNVLKRKTIFSKDLKIMKIFILFYITVFYNVAKCNFLGMTFHVYVQV